MRWLDILLGKTRAAKASLENLFSITTSRITLGIKFKAGPTGRAGIAFKPVESSFFDDAEEELKGLLNLAAGETGTEFHMLKDHYGYQWVVLFDHDFEDLVASLHMASQTLHEHGFGGQLLAALFQFTDSDQRRIYWIYNYKRGRFYPFVPLPDKKRDHALELRLRALMENEMPLEPELERWYPLWDIPLGVRSKIN
jgi:hypothetical protein